ncbi:hypothetical protein HDU76_000313 [Blyttiomyces sp. JEL0837]|nr:hypothetical protein HDU76_000313 [Blyttiomyces sp. JEL0837]
MKPQQAASNGDLVKNGRHSYHKPSAANLNSNSSTPVNATAAFVANPASLKNLRNSSTSRATKAITPAETSVQLVNALTQLTSTPVSISGIRTVLVVTRPHPDLIPLTVELANFLSRERHLAVLVGEELRDAKGLQGPLPSARDVLERLEAMEEQESIDGGGQRQFKGAVGTWDPKFCHDNADKIDLIVTLGGDGTVLYTSGLFQKKVPPIVPFYLGSLGFLTVFDFESYRNVLDRILSEEPMHMNLRMRLQASVYKGANTTSALVSPSPSEYDSNTLGYKPPQTPLEPPYTHGRFIKIESGLKSRIKTSDESKSSASPATSSKQTADHARCTRKEVLLDGANGSKYSYSKPNAAPFFVSRVLNEVVVDRGSNPTMLTLEIFAGDMHLTTLLADGLVIGTPTGSTAYSLSAGGSLVHPDKASVLVTPICPHTLTARPMVLPAGLELRIVIASDTRSTAWVSFDGRNRVQLYGGDTIVLHASRYPFITVCREDSSKDWFRSLVSSLGWNVRKRQQSFPAAKL